MTSNLATSPTTRSTRAHLLEESRDDDFRALPQDQLALIKDAAAPEDWGAEEVVLQRYLALHVPLALEQGRYVWNGKEIVMRAGHLATAAGAAVYMGLARADGERWSLTWAAERPSKVEDLGPTDLGVWPELDPRREVVVACDLPRARLGELSQVMQISALAGGVEWSIRRDQTARQIHREGRGYFVPIHLTDRNGAPELVAAVQVQSDRVVVRTLLDPEVAYAPARAVVERREQLPGWLR